MELKIAIFGYYNALNAGDERIQYCLIRALRQTGEENNVLVFLPHFMVPHAGFLREFDWAIIGGGGLVSQRGGIWHRMKRWIGRSRVKVGVVGLGISHLPDSLDRELGDLLDKSEFFFVRDCFSKSLLKNDARAQVGPDLAWMFPFSTSEQPDLGTLALNLAPCPWKDFDAALWVEALKGELVRPFPLFMTAERDLGLLRQFYGDTVPGEWTLEPLIQSEILVASRFHALIFALQLRRPFIAIGYDDKIKRLLTEADLLDCYLDTDQSDQIAAKLAWVRENKAALIQRIDAYALAQENAGVELRKFLRTSIESKRIRTEVSAQPQLLKP